jgi:hypothetical protein
MLCGIQVINQKFYLGSKFWTFTLALDNFLLLFWSGGVVTRISLVLTVTLDKINFVMTISFSLFESLNKEIHFGFEKYCFQYLSLNGQYKTALF